MSRSPYVNILNRKAQSQELLDRKYKEFQRRMSRHWLKMSEKNDEDSENNFNSENRQVLGNLGGSKRIRISVKLQW